MALLIRIDVDRAYGKNSFIKHVMSRLASDIYFPKIDKLGYLAPLVSVFAMLNKYKRNAYIFYRRCTLPNSMVMKEMLTNGHHIGLHLENSRSYKTFMNELQLLKGHSITAVSKHGSGQHKHGLYHYKSYEPEKYIEWCRQAGIRCFMGNGECPNSNKINKSGVEYFPDAFWLEEYW